MHPPKRSRKSVVILRTRHPLDLLEVIKQRRTVRRRPKWLHRGVICTLHQISCFLKDVLRVINCYLQPERVGT